MSIQINVCDLKNRMFELEVEKAAIKALIKIYDPATLAGERGAAFPVVIHQLESTSIPEPEGVVTMADKTEKRKYKKRKTSPAPATGSGDRLKGLRAIGAYIGVTEGNAWALRKSQELPVHKEGSATVASKNNLRRWVAAHPKYKVTEENEPASGSAVSAMQADESYQGTTITGKSKWIHKRCKGCNVMIHREVPEDFNESRIQFHSPACKKEWEIDHKAAK